MTTGINIALIGTLAATLGWKQEDCEKAMNELQDVGLIEHDPDYGLTVIPDQVVAADNISHTQGLLNRVSTKLPDSPLRSRYVELLTTHTKHAAKKWKKEGEEAIAMMDRLRDQIPDPQGEEDPLPF